MKVWVLQKDMEGPSLGFFATEEAAEKARRCCSYPNRCHEEKEFTDSTGKTWPARPGHDECQCQIDTDYCGRDPNEYFYEAYDVVE